MLTSDAEEPAHLFTPAPAFRPYVIEESGKRLVFCHREAAGAPEDQVVLDIEPLVDLLKYLRLICLDPLVFPYRILDAACNGTGYLKARDQLGNIRTGYLDAVRDTLSDLLSRPLIHVAHRPAQSIALPVYQHEPLHLRAERDA